MSGHVELLLGHLIAEQRETNDLLRQLIQVNSALIEALADERDPDVEPQTYLSGKVIR